MELERDLAKCGPCDLWLEDHGVLIVSLHFDYESGSSQGFPSYLADPSIIMRLMGVFGVDHLSQIKGRSCWVTHSHSEITKIEPLHAKDGTTFDLVEWKKWAKERLPQISPSEYRTGIDPNKDRKNPS